MNHSCELYLCVHDVSTPIINNHLLYYKTSESKWINNLKSHKIHLVIMMMM